MRAGTHSVDGASAGFDPHEVVAQLVQGEFDASLACFADGDDADDGGDADGYAKHGQDAAQLVREQCNERSPDHGARVEQVHHGKPRSAVAT